MSLSSEIVGSQGDSGKAGLLKANVQPFSVFGGKHAGLVVLHKEFQEFKPNLIPFTNATFGNAMNQNVAFGGTPELIFDGGSGGTEWTGSSSDGEWDFADAGVVTVDHAPDGTVALFSKGSTISSGSYTALTGSVDLDNYSPATQSMDVQFQIGGVPVGDPVVLDSFINTGDFASQTFTIPLANFNLGGVNVDEFTITVNRSAGHNPHVSFDDFTMQETGTPAIFKAFAADTKSDFHVSKVRFVLVDAIAGTVANGTMQGLAYDQILGVSSLANGINVQVVSDGVAEISASLKQLSDMLGIGADITESTSDGVNTMIVVELVFSQPVILRRGLEDQDFISITISDDLSGLLIFTGAARGAYEI